MAEFKQAPTAAAHAERQDIGGMPDLQLRAPSGFALTVFAIAAVGIAIALVWTAGTRRPWHREGRPHFDDADPAGSSPPTDDPTDDARPGSRDESRRREP